MAATWVQILGPLTSEHQGEPAGIRYQKTKPANTIDNLTKSAKPSSPVQIRAAPPNSLEELIVCASVAQARARRWTQLAPKSSRVARSCICKHQTRSSLPACRSEKEEVSEPPLTALKPKLCAKAQNVFPKTRDSRKRQTGRPIGTQPKFLRTTGRRCVLSFPRFEVLSPN